MFGGGDPGRVAIRPGCPTPMQCSCHKWFEGVTGIPEYAPPGPISSLSPTTVWNACRMGVCLLGVAPNQAEMRDTSNRG